jgi:prepilin-type N-terminal cleavage/methylation domain-containing protein
MRRYLHQGFTLIELMIAFAIFAGLLMLAGPMYAEYLGNAQIRNASESVLAGVRFTQAEAVRRNTDATFTLTAAGWTVDTQDEEGNAVAGLRAHKFIEGATDAKPTPNAGIVVFNGLGRIQAATTLAAIDFTNPKVSSPRDLRVVIGVAGIKLCDPKLAATDAAGCP